MKIKVFKFGGASVKDAEAVRNLAQILQSYPNQKLVVVVSAMGKTTNAMEKVASDYYNRDSHLQESLNKVKDYHNEIIESLFGKNSNEIPKIISSIYTQLEAQLKLPVSQDFDFVYDQIVSYGELLSTTIIHLFLTENSFSSQWFDARKLIITNSLHREAKIDWKLTSQQIFKASKECFKNHDIFITQGFIAANTKGETTTLGREGSDFTGAIFSNIVHSESLTIWKDVPGLLNADPKYFDDTIKIDSISYGETVELAYYGATIIHPKTIKPLQNNGIPLYIKSFINPSLSGSCIHTEKTHDNLIPSYIFKRHQVLISISPRNYSFMEEENLALIFGTLAHHHLKVNMMQNSAISFSICVDNRNHKVDRFINEIKKDYKVRYNRDLELLTIRHYNQEVIEKIVGTRPVLLEQRSRSTVQMVLKNE